MKLHLISKTDSSTKDVRHFTVCGKVIHWLPRITEVERGCKSCKRSIAGEHFDKGITADFLGFSATESEIARLAALMVETVAFGGNGPITA
jgi:hypothetical protein